MMLLFIMKKSSQEAPEEVLSTSGDGEAVGKAGKDLRSLPEGEKLGRIPRPPEEYEMRRQRGSGFPG